MKHLKNITILLIALFVACTPQTPATPDKPDQEQPEKPDQPDKPDTPDKPDKPDNPDQPDTPDKPDQPDTPDKPDQPDQPDDQVTVTVIDPGKTPEEFKPTPSRPDLIHEVSYTDFYNPLQDYLDEFGNTDYVCAQGDGTSFPLITEEGYIRFYQGTSEKKGGAYIRVRSHNGAKLTEVEVGTLGKTKLAYSKNGKAAKSETKELEAGEKYLIQASAEEDLEEITIYCMATEKSERWEMNYIRVKYRGGFIAEDFIQPSEEYGPLVRVDFPFVENFEKDFPTTEKPSYYKYGTTGGRENLQWSTWYGSFSWQNPIEGEQSAQLRIYQEEEDYEQSQYGYMKMEYFIENLKEVSFKYILSEYFLKAKISYYDFDGDEWKNPQPIALEKYAQRKELMEYRYILDDGRAHNAKIKIEIDPDSAFPSRDSYRLIVDCLEFR